MADGERRLAIFLNPSAAGGRAASLLPRVERELGGLGLAYRVVQTRNIGHAASEAGAASTAGETVIALGGDGLVGALAGAVRGQGALGVLPGGRGNDFARGLSIPSEVEAACRLIAEGEEQRLDLGEVNGRPFVCIASTGFDSDANRIANEARLIKGNLVYLYAALRALAAWRPARFTIRADGEDREFEGYTVAAANARFYGGGMCVAPSASMSDGLLDVIMIERSSKLRFLANLPKVFSGKHVSEEGVSSLRTREVEISANRPFDVYADGERTTELPAKVRIVPGELRVITP